MIKNPSYLVSQMMSKFKTLKKLFRNLKFWIVILDFLPACTPKKKTFNIDQFRILLWEVIACNICDLRYITRTLIEAEKRIFNVETKMSSKFKLRLGVSSDTEC